jgi:hypothetical protein
MGVGDDGFSFKLARIPRHEDPDLRAHRKRRQRVDVAATRAKIGAPAGDPRLRAKLNHFRFRRKRESLLDSPFPIGDGSRAIELGRRSGCRFVGVLGHFPPTIAQKFSAPQLTVNERIRAAIRARIGRAGLL